MCAMPRLFEERLCFLLLIDLGRHYITDEVGGRRGVPGTIPRLQVSNRTPIGTQGNAPGRYQVKIRKRIPGQLESSNDCCKCLSEQQYCRCWFVVWFDRAQGVCRGLLPTPSSMPISHLRNWAALRAFEQFKYYFAFRLKYPLNYLHLDQVAVQ